MQELRMEVLTPCNFNCSHCYTNKSPKSKFSLDQKLKVIEDSWAYGATSLSITGGEPLIRPSEVLSCVTYASGLGMYVRLNTNGWFLTNSLVSQLENAGLNEIQISVDHHEPEAFDSMRGKVGAYKRVFEAFSLLRNSPIKCSARFTLVNSNIDSLLPTYRDVRLAGVQKFKVRNLIETDNVSDKLSKHTGECKTKSALENLMLEADGDNVEVSLAIDDMLGEIDSKNISNNRCKCGTDAIFVSASGDVFACPFIREKSSMNAGSLKNTPFREIVSSTKIKEFIGSPEEGYANDAGCKCKAGILLGN